MGYSSLDTLLYAYQKFCDITRFEVTKDCKFIVAKNNKILKVGFHSIKDKDVFICYDKTSSHNKKNYIKSRIEFIFNKNPKTHSKEGFIVNSELFINKTYKEIGKKTCLVFSIPN
uniref:Uncharacterized protein n=1 Tax=viral metagenome TaxID=1070528 RepID=A0A6C0AC64_9ZZZZ